MQYGHARTCRMMANAADLGMSLADARPTSTRPCSPTRRRATLLRALAEFPRVVASAAELREPHRVARYLEDTTAIFNRWYDTRECRMLPQGDEPVAPSTRRAWCWSPPPARSSPTASACSASPRPERM